MNAQRGSDNIFDETKSGQISGVAAKFDTDILPKIIDATKTYWEDDFDFRLFDISNYEKVKDNKYLQGEIFFTSQVPSLNTPPVTIRLSSEFVRLFLHSAFGSNSGEFKLMDLSELEIKILNSYCDCIYKAFVSELIAPDELDKHELKNKDVYNFVIVIKNKEEKNSKLVVTLPKIRLKKKEIEKKENFTDEEFKNLSVVVDIVAGSSKITLNDLKSISDGDIILLEDSFVNKMKILSGYDIKEFKVNPDPSLMIELDEDEHDIEREENTKKNMWDDIQIEVNAQFKKVKMTLGELKHISKGLVIDLGSIFNNEISLLVENKTVAKGELVIINDKYAVKVNEVISEEQNRQHGAAQNAQTQKPQAQNKPQGQQKQAQSQQTQKPKPQAQAQNDEVEEDFDYSDFEEEK